MPDLPLREEIGRHVHDAFFRLMLSDPVRADAVLRTHWPNPLRSLLKGQPARPLDSALVRQNLQQFRTDSLFLIGGTGNRANAAVIPEQKFRPEKRTPRQTGGYLRTARTVIPDSHQLWFLAMVFHTGGWDWNVSGVIDESSDDPMHIARQMHDPEWYFLRETRKIDYGELSCEPVSRAMLGMMGIADRQPYPLDELACIWREDVVPHEAGLRLGLHMASFALATSTLSKEELGELTLETGLIGKEEDMGLVLNPLIEEAAERGFAEGMARGKAEGMARGKAEGMAEGKAEGMAEGMAEGESLGRTRLLLYQIRRRFGTLPEEVELKVRSAPASDLEAWADAVLSARSLDEVFRNGQSV